MKYKNLFLSLMIFFFTATASANIFLYHSNKKTKGYDLSLTQYSITDITLSGGSTKILVPKTLSAELVVRMFHNFLLTLIIQDSLTDPAAPNLKNTEYGLGVKVNLPGFFLINAKKRQLIHKAKNKPYNTSVYANLLSYDLRNTYDNTSVEGYETIFGLQYDQFLFSPLYLKLNFQLHNRAGNFFNGFGIGLGYEF